MANKVKNYPTLPRLINSKQGGSRIYTKTLDTSIDALAGQFAGSKTTGRFSLHLIDADEANYCIQLKGGEAKVVKGHDENADLHIATTKETWVEIATGRLSPPMAYLSGKMRVSGNMGFIKRVYSLASKKELVDFNF